MRFAAILLLLALAGCSSIPAPGATADVDAIYQHFALAYRNLDANAVGALYADNAIYLAPSEKSITRGRAAIVARIGAFFDTVRQRNEQLTVEFKIIERDRRDDIVVDSGYYLLHTSAPNAQPSAGKFVTVSRRDRDGRWRFHVDTYSGAAATAFEEAHDIRP